MRKIVFILVFVLVAQFSVDAQSVLMKRANQAFNDLNYQKAIELYTRLLKKHDNALAKINLSEAYRKVGNTEKAEYWLGQVVDLPDSKPIHKLYYGQMLQTNGKCDVAREWYQKYVEEVPDDLRGQYLVRACDYAKELMTKNQAVYEIEPVPFNTKKGDFSPMFFQKGIVYSSEHQEPGVPIKISHSWTGEPFLKLFYVSREKKRSRKKEFHFTYGEPRSFSNRLNTKFHNATIVFNKDETKAYFTRNNYNAGKVGTDDKGGVRLKIYSAKNNGTSTWREIEGLPFNSDKYSVAHPALSLDGNKMYFSSDMPGGFGGMDLYVVEMDNGRWGLPVNLGSSINTEGNEVFPYVSPDGRLFFSSDGHVGLGGLDIYHMEIKERGTFGDIINEGFPINSVSDDFGIIMQEDGRFGYFSSDREGGVGGDDIYSFTKITTPVRLFVYDEKTGKGIKNAKVTSECTGISYTTNAEGIVNLDQKLDVCCNFVVASEGFEGNAKEGCTTNLEKGSRVMVEIPLGISLEFHIQGMVYDEKTRQPIHGATVQLISSCEDEERTTTTNRKGEYSFEIEKECCYEVKTVNNANYVPYTSKQRCVKGLKESTTLEQDLTLQMLPPPINPSPAIASTLEQKKEPKSNTNYPNATTRPVSSGATASEDTSVSTTTKPSSSPTSKTNESLINSSDNTDKTTLADFDKERTPSTYLNHIYYDFDESHIRKDAIVELTKLYKLLKDNPQYIVEIGSHTDSREADKYRLSQRRAEAVVRWLEEKGIAAARMKPKGYGETVNVNHCSNNIPCSEEEHQRNRRTEFKIIGNVDSAKEHSKVTKSKKTKKIEVDTCPECPF